MLVQLKGYPRTKRLHLFTCIEETLYGKIVQLTAGELADRENTIDRIVRELHLTAPIIDWAQTQVEITNMADSGRLGKWIAHVTGPLTDPDGVLDFVPLRNDYEGQDAPNERMPNSGRQSFYYTLFSNYEDDARQELHEALARYRDDIARMCREVDSFNAALPYLTACLVDLKIEHGDLGKAIDWSAR
ncbi:MAG: hypothetical protein AB7U35_08885 [Sphingobium sp.]